MQSVINGSAFLLPVDNFKCQNVILTSLDCEAIVPFTAKKKLLENAVLVTLECADKVKASTVAIPSIGANYTHLYENACPILVDAIVTYFKLHPLSSIKTVRLVDINASMIIALMEALEKHIDVITEDILSQTDPADNRSGNSKFSSFLLMHS